MKIGELPPTSIGAELKQAADFIPGALQLRAIVSCTEKFLLHTGVIKQPEIQDHYYTHLSQENNALNLTLTALPLICLAAKYYGMKTSNAWALFLSGNLIALNHRNRWSSKTWDAYTSVAVGNNPALRYDFNLNGWSFRPNTKNASFFKKTHPLHSHFIRAALEHSWTAALTLLKELDLPESEKNQIYADAIRLAGNDIHPDLIPQYAQLRYDSMRPAPDQTPVLELNSLVDHEKESREFLKAFARLQTPKENESGVGYFMHEELRNDREFKRQLFWINYDCDAFLSPETQEEMSPQESAGLAEQNVMVNSFSSDITWMLQQIIASTDTTDQGKINAVRKLISKFTPRKAAAALEINSTIQESLATYWPDRYMTAAAWPAFTEEYGTLTPGIQERLIEKFPALEEGVNGDTPQWAQDAYAETQLTS